MRIKPTFVNNMLWYLWFAFFCCAFQGAVCTVSEIEKEIIDKILAPDKYDPRVRPSGGNGTSGNGPTIVTVNFFVRSISSIDDVNMQYSTQLTFRQQWQDERLKYDNYSGLIKYLTVTKAKLLWVPDLFFSNEKEVHFHDAMTPNLYYRIFPNGHVIYSRRVSLVLNCPMNFKSYPMDHQMCSIRIASYAYTTENIVILWKEDDPVQIVRNLYLPNFSLKAFSTDYCNSRTITGEYSCIKADLVFKRELFQYLIKVYIPQIMIVMVACSSLWVDPEAITARLMLSFGSLMVAAAHASFITASLPAVSYSTSINIWLGVCVTFAFAVLLESLTVHYLSRHWISDKTENHPDQSSSNDDALPVKSTSKTEQKCTLRQHLRKLNCCQLCYQKYNIKPKRIDVVARISVFGLFVLFNLIYWIPYSLSSDI